MNLYRCERIDWTLPNSANAYNSTPQIQTLRRLTMVVEKMNSTFCRDENWHPRC